MYYINDLEVFFSEFSPEENRTEIQKAEEIVDQFNNSIEWLNFEASRKNDYQEKIVLQQEATAAIWERDILIKEINKAKK